MSEQSEHCECLDQNISMFGSPSSFALDPWGRCRARGAPPMHSDLEGLLRSEHSFIWVAVAGAAALARNGTARWECGTMRR